MERQLELKSCVIAIVVLGAAPQAKAETVAFKSFTHVTNILLDMVCHIVVFKSLSFAEADNGFHVGTEGRWSRNLVETSNGQKGIFTDSTTFRKDAEANGPVIGRVS